VKRILGTVLGIGAVVMVVGAVQGGSSPAPVAALLGQAAPTTAPPVATITAAAPTTTAAPRRTVENTPGRVKDAPPVATTGRRASPAVHFESCAAARAAGAAPLLRGQAGYRAGLDRDGDGVACET
jgi:hypothetical protein